MKHELGQPNQRSKEALEDEITRLAGDLHAATYRFLTLVGEFDRIGGWNGVGVRSCAHWLTWRCGIDIATGREKVRVARAIETLPHTAEALRLGKLSYSKARAITRIATPENERFLVDVALSGTTGHLERLVRYARKYGPEAAAERAAHQHVDRFVKTWTDDDGAVVISGRLPPELGAVVVKALDAAVDAARQRAFEQASPNAETATADPAAAPTDGFGANRADALVDLAESFLASGYREGNAGERYQVVVHVDAHVTADAARDDDPGTPAAPYIEDVGAIADDTARQLACDASAVVMTERDGETVDVGRRTRTIPPAIRRALTHRDGGCVFPGCTCRRFVDAHHIIHWADGGRTALDNLVLLCRHHHRLAHTEGYTFQLKRGRVTVTRPDARPVPRHFALRVPRDGPDAIAHANRDLGLTITHRTCTPRWGGEPMDYNLALSILGDIHDGRRAPPPPAANDDDASTRRRRHQPGVK
ncbi:MAG: HNH endonuclease [Deltaproteobacteria bacterium HGW-Deltaproteobacteria-14]|jgi:5-methylcytosine-specific restriction endonuclease McrA|nr:MAG: HNH endonuclease [Deltaproteobacteria bacterium HGW-Deltaproteobacteria-14]